MPATRDPIRDFAPPRSMPYEESNPEIPDMKGKPIIESIIMIF